MLDPAREMLCHMQRIHLETREKQRGESCSRFSLVYRTNIPAVLAFPFLKA